MDESPSPKTCTQCGEVKPITDFHNRASSRDGKSSYCRDCNREKNNRWRVANVEKRREQRVRYYQANREQIRAKQRQYTADNREELRIRTQLRKYGMTPDDYAALEASQDGLCAICGAGSAGGHGTWHIDHDHACCDGVKSCGACVRGLLCTKCNTGLAMFRDDLTFLSAAIEYLRRNSVGIVNNKESTCP